MSWEGWIQYAGTELVSNARVAAYAGARGVHLACSCPELAASLGDPPYTTPEQDPAPWFDPNQDESRDFFGLLGLELTGAGDSPADRDVTEYLGDGGQLGAARYGTREVEVKAVAVAATRAALTYGIGWLDTALQGSVCHTSCSGDTLCLYTACPERPRLDSGDDCSSSVGPPDPHWDPVQAGDQLVRQVFQVGRTEGPTVSEVRHLNGVWLGEVSFTVTAGMPWWWRLPRFVVSDTVPPDYTDTVPNYTPLPAQPCPDPPDCMATNPYCTGPNKPWPDEPFPGSSPYDTTLLDPCYPTSAFTARRAFWRVPTDTMPRWSATAPVVTLRSGKSPLRRVTLRWYTNPRNQRPSNQLDPCSACAEMTLPWIPERTTVTLDSRTHTVAVNCGGKGTITSGTTVYGPWGGAYTWPVFECPTPLVVELVALDTSWTSDVRYTVELASRQGVA